MHFWSVSPFYAPLKTPENQRFSGGIKWERKESGTLKEYLFFFKQHTFFFLVFCFLLITILRFLFPTS